MFTKLMAQYINKSGVVADSTPTVVSVPYVIACPLGKEPVQFATPKSADVGLWARGGRPVSIQVIGLPHRSDWFDRKPHALLA